MKNSFPDGTAREVARMKAEGMRCLTPAELVKELATLGYRIESAFNYANTANANSYDARACRVVQTSDGLGFANTNARRDAAFKALQHMRQWTFALNAGRIWEI